MVVGWGTGGSCGTAAGIPAYGPTTQQGENTFSAKPGRKRH